MNDNSKYIISKEQSKEIQQECFRSFADIKIKMDIFEKEGLPEMWKSYQQKIKNGTASENAFYKAFDEYYEKERVCQN